MSPSIGKHERGRHRRENRCIPTIWRDRGSIVGRPTLASATAGEDSIRDLGFISCRFTASPGHRHSRGCRFLLPSHHAFHARHDRRHRCPRFRREVDVRGSVCGAVGTERSSQGMLFGNLPLGGRKLREQRNAIRRGETERSHQ